MSKAFTKEQDSDSPVSQDEAAGPEPALPTGFKNYMTPPGAARLREELKQLLHVERPELVKTVSWAASNGDRSENGDYIYGKRRLREIDRRIRFLTKRLESAVIVDPSVQNAERVLFGARVTVRDEEDRERTYRIVGIDEADVRNGDVSWISPIAKALLNAKVGDTVNLRTPRGEEELEILRIRYEG
ncbi:MAG: transcription elongation factor GreB [Bdellovibrionales bacterium RIFOXYC1_FULL_54_43]|nr:MAG: transcription elongation factor GreB [Bdellovibrionales bacterium RIFOXYC1_FULL_54_43]OFZ83392.1 MAG: transcription elongation factor GreB [Bdellovibrionales bacterium RIFOXYD1_FULL_55_31]